MPLSKEKTTLKAHFGDNPKAIARHLSEALATNQLEAVLVALNQIVVAQNVAALGRKIGLGRETLYRSFGGTVDPSLGRVLKLLTGLNVYLLAVPGSRAKSIRPRTRRKPLTEYFGDNPKAIARLLTFALATNQLQPVLTALNQIVVAQNVAALSRKIGLGRERLYRTFGGTADPWFSRVLRLLDGLNVRLVAVAGAARSIPIRPKIGRPRKN
jgi:probable addiction module antidote protein